MNMELDNIIHLNFSEQQPDKLMQYRIHKILLVCCSYDEYILEEDGHIDTQINREYSELNISNPPTIIQLVGQPIGVPLVLHFRGIVLRC